MRHDLVLEAVNKASMQTLLSDIQEYISTTFLPVRQAQQLDVHQDLMEANVLDSLAFIEVVAEIKRRYAMTINAADVTQENFGSIHAIASYVHRTQQR